MVDRIGIGSPSSSLARAAIEAALKRQAEATRSMTEVAHPGAAARADGPDFSRALADTVKAVDNDVRKADALVEQVVAGQVNDFSEVAAQLKQSELSLRFALEVRNKFIDAYREVMRMGV